jgi:DNA repair protein RadB
MHGEKVFSTFRMPDAIPVGGPLDGLFGGGVRTRTLTQVYGPAGAGKTNVALLATVNAARMGLRAAFIDPEGSFSVPRLKQIAGSDFDRVVESTRLFEPSSFAEQQQAIEKLHSLSGIGLAVVDSIVYHYRLEFDHDEPLRVSRELGRQMASLLRLARERECAVLVTNQVYTNPDSQKLEPVGGDVMRYGSKIIIELSHSSPRVARVVKHAFMPSGVACEYEIVEKGIV